MPALSSMQHLLKNKIKMKKTDKLHHQVAAWPGSHMSHCIRFIKRGHLMWLRHTVRPLPSYGKNKEHHQSNATAVSPAQLRAYFNPWKVPFSCSVYPVLPAPAPSNSCDHSHLPLPHPLREPVQQEGKYVPPIFQKEKL